MVAVGGLGGQALVDDGFAAHHFLAGIGGNSRMKAHETSAIWPLS
jgi:hypothetical protein